MSKFIRNLFILIAFIYFVFPRDLIPDIGLIGRLDDVLMILFLWWQYKSRFGKLKREKRSDSKESKREEPTKQKSSDPYEVLGLAREATEEDITEAYRELVTKYHPDKVQHLGREFNELAHERMVEIQSAYRELMRLRS